MVNLMKAIFGWLRNVSFRSLRMRLVVYLLIAGSVPLLCALLVEYNQSAHYAEREYESFVKQNHTMIGEQLEQSFLRLERLAGQLNEEPTVRLLTQADDNNAAVQQVLLNDLNQLMNNVMRGDYPIRDVCFSFSQTNMSVCSTAQIVQTTTPLHKDDLRIETFIDQERKETLRLVAPLYHKFSTISEGYVLFVIDERQRAIPDHGACAACQLRNAINSC